jgi:hypothetical protein
VDGFNIELDFDSGGSLTNITVNVPQVTLTVDAQGRLDPYLSPSLHNVFSKALLVVNTLNFETGKPIQFSSRFPQAQFVAENPSEQALLNSKTKIGRTNLTIDAILVKDEPATGIDFERFLGHEDALSLYTDAQQSQNAISKFILYYRVLENYVSQEGSAFDVRVARFASQYNPAWDQAKINQLRNIRNGCAHAKTGRLIITQANIQLAEQHLQTIEAIARKFIES